uniref:DBD_Tnp_Mut domain-containing protein n=1 Tax=Caenorhabditis tropicalis TaxID=1561998 RepID=A0A1I7V0C7_9PELO
MPANMFSNLFDDDDDGILDGAWKDQKNEKGGQKGQQGIMTTVIHVMDRNLMKSGRAEQCQKMCEVFGDSSKMANSNYKQTLTKSIERMCAPVDTYAACLYHTVKFDVNSNL